MQATDTELRIEIERLQVLLKDTKRISDSNFQLYVKLQDNVRSFFREHVGTGEDNVYVSLDSINSFLAENSIETIKKTFAVYFTIDGYAEVEAESAEEASDMCSNIEASSWDIEISSSELSIDAVTPL
jgi:septum formation topological specificity factor MinE